jgi:hypothetical protein
MKLASNLLNQLNLFYNFLYANFLKHEVTKALRHEVFCKTNMLINGIYFQPFEPIERIEPLEHFLDTNFLKHEVTKAQRHKVLYNKDANNWKTLPPFVRVENLQPLQNSNSLHLWGKGWGWGLLLLYQHLPRFQNLSIYISKCQCIYPRT